MSSVGSIFTLGDSGIMVLLSMDTVLCISLLSIVTVSGASAMTLNDPTVFQNNFIEGRFDKRAGYVLRSDGM